ncbi:hypothetical protein CCMA1212_001782 [Trichoderma ghanense]|uniref:Uncharacterized protein n=1 Tax=Trichoderma ghanense TaxID=65468 RepID=A0ABY2HDE2_9HYPO
MDKYRHRALPRANPAAARLCTAQALFDVMTGREYVHGAYRTRDALACVQDKDKEINGPAVAKQSKQRRRGWVLVAGTSKRLRAATDGRTMAGSNEQRKNERNKAPTSRNKTSTA